MFHQFEWQTVFQTTNEDEAQARAGALETMGIMARVHQEADAVLLLVDARDYEQALVVLGEPATGMQ